MDGTVDGNILHHLGSKKPKLPLNWRRISSINSMGMEPPYLPVGPQKIQHHTRKMPRMWSKPVHRKNRPDTGETDNFYFFSDFELYILYNISQYIHTQYLFFLNLVSHEIKHGYFGEYGLHF